MTERPTLEVLCARIEALALSGALADPCPDKSDWIRVWAAARWAGGHEAGADAWAAAFALRQQEEQERARWLLRTSGPHSAQTDLDDLFGPGRQP